MSELEEEKVDPCAVNTTGTEEAASNAKVLQAVGLTYGIVFSILLLLYCLMRNRYKNLFHCRASVEALTCELCKTPYSAFGWITGVLKATDEELFEQCGFDAACFSRLLRLGTKLAMMGSFIALWLAPTYYSSPTRPSNELVTDSLDKLSLGHLHSNDPRLLLSVFACYLLNLFAMYLLYQDFSWYIECKHKYRMREAPENYSCYIGGLPADLMSKKELERYLSILFKGDVLEVHIARNVQDLEKIRAEIDALAPKLDHAKLVLELSGERPMHKTKMFRGAEVDSIEEYGSLLKDAGARYAAALAGLQSEWDSLERKGGAEDQAKGGSTRDAALVSFKTLWSANCAVQAVTHTVSLPGPSHWQLPT